MTPAEAKAERENQNDSRDVVRPAAQGGTEEEAEVPNTRRKKKQKATTPESQPDEAEDANKVQQPEASKATSRKTSKRNFDIFKPPKEDESDEDIESPKKKPKVKAKAAKASVKETAPTRKSARVALGKDVNEPPEDGDEEEEGEGEEAYDEPSSSAKGGKRKKKAATVTTVSKKAKTKR